MTHLRTAASTVSVLICTADRPALLDRALTALARGHEQPEQLVVVNGGGDETNRIVAAYAARFADVILLQYPNRNLALSRNIGLPHCTGEIVAMTDDDAEVAPDWISRVKQVHAEEEQAGAVGGPVEGKEDQRFISRLADRVVFPRFKTRARVRTLAGVNVAYKLSAMKRVGLYDPCLFRGEDVDFNWRLIRCGYYLVYDPGIRVTHLHRPSFRGLLRQQYMYGCAYTLVRRKWPDMYSVYPHRLVSLHDWLKLVHCVVAVLYQPALAAARMPSLPDRITAYPPLVVHHLVWKLGMARQALADGCGKRSIPQPKQPAVTLVRRWQAGQVCDESTSSRGVPIPR